MTFRSHLRLRKNHPSSNENPLQGRMLLFSNCHWSRGLNVSNMAANTISLVCLTQFVQGPSTCEVSKNFGILNLFLLTIYGTWCILPYLANPPHNYVSVSYVYSSQEQQPTHGLKGRGRYLYLFAALKEKEKGPVFCAHSRKIDWSVCIHSAGDSLTTAQGAHAILDQNYRLQVAIQGQHQT